VRLGPSEAWRASRTPAGPATVHLRVVAGELRAQAWGPGGEWILAHAPALVGEYDNEEDFQPRPGLLSALRSRLVGLRLGRAGTVSELVIPTVLEQRVTSIEAARSYRGLIDDLGEPAPGPAAAYGLRLPPAPAVLAELPSWAWHRYGVERQRADTARRACALARRLDEDMDLLADADSAERQAACARVRARLATIAGIGPWSIGELGVAALGDPDAVTTGDFHLPHVVAHALGGRPRGDDRLMLELLAPYVGHRGRVLRLLVMGGVREPAYGPRQPLSHIARR
jgi:3-methyladenine DNA glycosylase/8-oxoguanine DNA glycosylase